MKKNYPYILLGIVSFLFLSGCSEQASSNHLLTDTSDRIIIDFWHGMVGAHEDVLSEIINDFNNSQDRIYVVGVSQGGYNELNQTIMANARSNTLPHIAQAGTDVVTQYINNNFIYPLNEFILDAQLGLSQSEVDDIIEVFREGIIWEETFYSIPFSRGTRILYYNRTMLEEVGIDVPTTWEELREAAETLTNDRTVGMGFENTFDSEFIALLNQKGGTFIDEDELVAHFAAEEGVEALTFIYSMIDDGIARFADEDRFLSGPFSRGSVAMYIGSSAAIPHIESTLHPGIEWGTATIPTHDGNKATRFSGSDVVMFDTGTDDEKKAAWEFMRYLFEVDVSVKWTTASGHIPTRYSAKNSPEFKEFLEENPIHEAASRQVGSGFMTARVNGAHAIRDILRDELDEVFLGRKTIETGLQDAEDRANEVLISQN